MSIQTATQEVKKRSAWSICMGVLTAALGVFLIAYPLVTSTITTLLIGWVLILVGVAEFVFALHSQTAGSFFLKILFGVMFAITGLALAFFPLAGIAALTILLGALLLAQGIAATVMAFQVRPLNGWGWFLFDAATSFFLGGLILFRWPSSSVWAIGTLVGVSVLMGGISRIMFAARIRRGANRVDSIVQPAA